MRTFAPFAMALAQSLERGLSPRCRCSAMATKGACPMALGGHPPSLARVLCPSLCAVDQAASERLRFSGWRTGSLPSARFSGGQLSASQALLPACLLVPGHDWPSIAFGTLGQDTLEYMSWLPAPSQGMPPIVAVLVAIQLLASLLPPPHLFANACIRDKAETRRRQRTRFRRAYDLLIPAE